MAVSPRETAGKWLPKIVRESSRAAVAPRPQTGYVPIRMRRALGQYFFRRGDSLTGTRPPAPILAAALLISFYEWAVFIATPFASGAIGLDYQGLGTDWMAFDAAARIAMSGGAATIYDGQVVTDYINRTYADWLSSSLSYRPWVNPPWFLLLVAPFSFFGFPASFALGQLAQAVLLGIWARRERVLPILLLLISPAMAVNATSGQAALLACVLALASVCYAQDRPWLSGTALALLSFKPQMGIVIVVYLLAGWQWRTLCVATVVGLGLLAGSLLAFGIAPWLGWIGVISGGLGAAGQWTEAGRLWGHSVHACLVASGAGASLASAVQWAVTAACLVCTVLIARKGRGGAHDVAALLILTLLAAPHSGPYDMIVPLAGLLLLYGRVPEAMPRSLGAWCVPLLVWLLPFYSPPATNMLGRLTPLILAAALAQLYWRGSQQPTRRVPGGA